MHQHTPSLNADGVGVAEMHVAVDPTLNSLHAGSLPGRQRNSLCACQLLAGVCSPGLFQGILSYVH